jgi:hypothetical protein
MITQRETMSYAPEQAEIGKNPSPKPQTPEYPASADPSPKKVPKKSALYPRKFENYQNEPQPPTPWGYQNSPQILIQKSSTKRERPKNGPSGSSANDPKPKSEDNAPILTEEVGSCGYFELFKKGDRSMKVLVVLGHIFAAASGVLRGLIGVVLGDSVGDLGAENPAGVTNAVAKIAIKSVFVGIASMVFSALSNYIWTHLQHSMSHRVKSLYFSKILEKDMGWYDRKSPEKITSEYNIDSLTYQKGIGYANGQMSYTVAVTLTGVFIGFYRAPIFA